MISDNFLTNTPAEMAEFIAFCARRGWCSQPIYPIGFAPRGCVDYRDVLRWARDIVAKGIERGWIKPAKAGGPLPEFVCIGEFTKHAWAVLPGGIGIYCVRRGCNAKPSRAQNLRRGRPQQPTRIPTKQGIN